MKWREYPRFKDSGVEWLGEIPENWEALAIKRITRIPVTDGPHETPEILDEGIPFISAEAIKNDKIDFGKMRGFISAEDHARFSKKYRPQRGDIFLIKSGATTGNVAFVDTDEEFNIWSPLAAIRPDHKKALTAFVFFFMKSINFFQSIELGWSYGTQQNIGMNVIENIPIALPPLLEQCDISAFLDRETSKIDRLIAKIQESIDRLKEYRTALISAVVTGRIDVRRAGT
jgi:type I restriction enzyme S subunit